MSSKKLSWNDKKLKTVNEQVEVEKTIYLSDEDLEQQIINSVDQTKKNKVSSLPVSNKIVLKAVGENEDGDAYLFIKCLKNRYAYDHTANDWYYWNDHYWRLDELNHVSVLIKEVIDLYGEQLVYENLTHQKAKKEENESDIKSHKYNIRILRDRIEQLRTLPRKERVMKIARSGLGSLGVTGKDWDKNPWLLGCKNGCLDLKNGTFEEGRPEDYIRMISPIEWHGADAKRDDWERYLLQMFSNKQHMVDYIQRLLGYGITGLNTEHIFPIFWGPKGRNGKSTLFEMIKFVLGSLAYKAPSNFIMDKAFKGTGTGPDAVTMGLMGKRIVWFSETGENDRLDVAKMKEMSGGDTLSARAPHAKRQSEFEQTHLMLTITNKKPKMPANDPAVWYRTHLIPLENSFIDNPDPDNPREFKANKDLSMTLKKQAPGILAWLVEGAVLWQEYGLNPPDEVNAATKEYQKSQDIFGHFIQECCVCGDDVYRVTRKKIYESYKDWCEEVGHRPMALNRVAEELRTRFGRRKKNRGVRYYKKIMLIDHPED